MKFESINAARRYWIAGIALALAGVLVARVVAPYFETKTAAIVKAVGQITAIVGLFIISIGVSRRVSKQDPSDT